MYNRIAVYDIYTTQVTDHEEEEEEEKRGQLLLYFPGPTFAGDSLSLYCIIITTTPVVSERNICPFNGQTTDTYSKLYSLLYINTLSRKLFDTLLSAPLTKG
jgi:hypothetical protein